MNRRSAFAFFAFAALTTLISIPSRGQEVGAIYTVTQRGGGLGMYIDEKVTFSMSPHDRRWIAERVKHDHNWCGQTGPGKGCTATDTSVHEWIDGGSCPALLESLHALSSVHTDGFIDPKHMDQITISDTPLFEVSGPSPVAAGYGASLKVSAYTGPYVDWWRQSQERLRRCWSFRAIG